MRSERIAHRRAGRRALGHWSGAAVATAAALTLAAAPAFAHNGIGAAFKGHAGRYIVYAYDGEPLPGSRIDYKLVLLNARTRNPVYGVRPQVIATRLASGTAGSAGLPGHVTAFGNVFFYSLPNPYPRDWVVHLHLRGPLGAGTVSFRMHGAAATPAAPVPAARSGGKGSALPVLLAVVGIGVAIVVALTVLLGRRPRSPGGGAQASAD